MRIAFITHQFFPAFYTGVERLTLNLAAQLGRMGHDCVVVTSAAHSSGSDAPYAWSRVWVRPLELAPVDVTRPWLQDAEAEIQVSEVLSEEQVELVHVMHPLRLPCVFGVAERRGLPVVAHVADFFYICSRINMLRVDGSLCTGAHDGDACVSVCKVASGVDRLVWARSLLARAAAVVSPCRFTIDVHRSQRFSTEHWHHVPWGVDYGIHPERLPMPTDGVLRIGFIGTLLAHKGARTLVEAVRRLGARNVELRLYGGSFHEEEYERELRRLSAGDDRIRFEGSYTHDDLRSILAPLQVVAIPSLWHENLPSTGLNAVAAGIPIIASNVGGVRELIDDYDCGFAFPPGNVEALATLLEELCSNLATLGEVRRRMRYPPGLEEEAWAIEGIYSEALEVAEGYRARSAG